MQLFIKEENGRFYPCLEDGTTVKGISQFKFEIRSGAVTEATMTFYPAGFIRSDGTTVQGINNGFLSADG